MTQIKFKKKLITFLLFFEYLTQLMIVHTLCSWSSWLWIWFVWKVLMQSQTSAEFSFQKEIMWDVKIIQFLLKTYTYSELLMALYNFSDLSHKRLISLSQCQMRLTQLLIRIRFDPIDYQFLTNVQRINFDLRNLLVVVPVQHIIVRVKRIFIFSKI